MQYKHETGIILSTTKDSLHITDGESTHVEFPKDVIWELHKKAPGIVYCLAHTHPPAASSLSGEDMTTLEGWAQALYPFPIRMSVTTQAHEHTFITTTFLGIWQSFEEWERKGKQKEGRQVTVVQEKIKIFTYPQDFSPEGLSMDQFQDYMKGERKKAKMASWENLILKKSYPSE